MSLARLSAKHPVLISGVPSGHRAGDHCLLPPQPSISIDCVGAAVVSRAFETIAAHPEQSRGRVGSDQRRFQHRCRCQELSDA